MKIRPQWRDWFIGFVEGDGYFGFGRAKYPVVEIYQKELRILEHIKETLGFGSISRHPVSGCYTWRATNPKHLQRIMDLFNGRIRTWYRYNQFQAFVSIYNFRYSKLEKPIVFKGNRPNILFEDAWLSGFIDAEGSFHVYFYKRSYKVQIRFKVGQKSDKELCRNIWSLFRGSKSASVQFFKKHDFYEFRLDSIKGVALLFPYLEQFPLKTQKKESYKRWKIIHQKLVDKRHLQEQKRQELILEGQKINHFIEPK